MHTMMLMPWLLLGPLAQDVVSAERGVTLRERSLANASLSPTIVSEPMDWQESRAAFEVYPAEASGILEAEAESISTVLGLDVTTDMSNPDQHCQVWSLLKGIVHRFRRQNQIVHANAHYFISTGVEVGCRTMVVDPDTSQESEVELFPQPEQCRHCTNHGRYCIIPTEGSNRTGTQLVEETLRLICFARLYHSSDLKFWEYMEAFDRLDCTDAQCAQQAMAQVPGTSFRGVESCMHSAGGTTEDRQNVHLQVEVDQRKNLNRLSQYGPSDLPMLHVGGVKYVDDDQWAVPGIFSFVCDVFHAQTKVKPMACQFCEECHDVRKCIWKLECDGQPFDVKHFSPSASPTLVPTATPSTAPSLSPSMLPTVATTPPTGNRTFFALTSAPTFDSIEERKKQQKEMDQLYVQWAIALGLLFGAVFLFVAVVEGRKHRQRNLTEQYKRETQARWRARELERMPEMYSVGWPTGFVANTPKANRVSRKHRTRKSLHEQRINQDHSQSNTLTGLFQGFTRTGTVEESPAVTMYKQQQNIMPQRASNEGLTPGFSRFLSLDSSHDFRSGRERAPPPTSMRGSVSVDSAAGIRMGRYRRDADEDDRLSPVHAAALMEAAATSSPVPAQPITNKSSKARRPLRLERIISEGSKEGEFDEPTPPTKMDRNSYSTSWLIRANTGQGPSGRGPILAPPRETTSYDGLEDVTRL